MTIRKAIPLLWKYLLVVAISCMLAFVISRDGRAEGVQVKKSSVSAVYERFGIYEVGQIDQDWRDEGRARNIPIRIIAPKISAAAAEKLRSEKTKFPVILFSHGLGGSRSSGKIWGEHWASHGYIVVHIQHPGSDESIWQGKRGEPAVGSMKAAKTMSNVGLRIGDVHFAIDEITKRSNRDEAEFRFADVNKIGMSGHSFGAQTTMAIAGQATPGVRGQSGLDSRIRAAIAFSPNARAKVGLDKQFGDIRIPVFSITGTLDGSVLNDGTKVAHRLLPHQHMPAGDKYLLVYDGGDHMVFGGQKIAGRRSETARDVAIRQNVQAATLAYWNVYLKNDVDARRWLIDTRGGFRDTLATADRFDTK